MKTYDYLGYYNNREDILALYNSNADQVIGFFENGEGAFHSIEPSSDGNLDEYDDITEEKGYYYTSDREYIVRYIGGSIKSFDYGWYIEIFKLRHDEDSVTLSELSRQTINIFDRIIKEIKYIVKNKGGFLATDEKYDTMYGYVVDCDDVQELKIVALRVTNGVLEIALCPKSMKYIISLATDLEDDDWYLCEPYSDNVLIPNTILSIADTLEAYCR